MTSHFQQITTIMVLGWLWVVLGGSIVEVGGSRVAIRGSGWFYGSYEWF